MAKKQSKKEKEAIDKFKRDTKGMSSSKIIEYMKLSEIEKYKFVQKSRVGYDIIPVVEDHTTKIDNNKKSTLNKKERGKGFRAERIWIKGNDAISQECQRSNDVRNSAQYFERSNYFKNRDLLRDRKQAGDKEFKIPKKDRYIYHNELDKLKDKVEFIINDNGIEIDKYKKFKDAYYSMSMTALSQRH